MPPNFKFTPAQKGSITKYRRAEQSKRRGVYHVAGTTSPGVNFNITQVITKNNPMNVDPKIFEAMKFAAGHKNFVAPQPAPAPAIPAPIDVEEVIAHLAPGEMVTWMHDINGNIILLHDDQEEDILPAIPAPQPMDDDAISLGSQDTEGGEYYDSDEEELF